MSYIWIDNIEYFIVLPIGFYEITDITAYIQYIKGVNNHTMTNTESGSITYFIGEKAGFRGWHLRFGHFAGVTIECWPKMGGDILKMTKMRGWQALVTPSFGHHQNVTLLVVVCFNCHPGFFARFTLSPPVGARSFIVSPITRSMAAFVIPHHQATLNEMDRIVAAADSHASVLEILNAGPAKIISEVKRAYIKLAAVSRRPR